jgi:hypothetical protein
LSARFSFKDLAGFLALSFFGDLSPISTVHPLSSVVVARPSSVDATREARTT